MFKAVMVEGRTRIQTYCDICTERIDVAGLGLYTWKRRSEATGSELVFLHKGGCHRAHERAHGWQPWHELSWFPIYMGNNVGMDWDRTAESMHRMAELGV